MTGAADAAAPPLPSAPPPDTSNNDVSDEWSSHSSHNHNGQAIESGCSAQPTDAAYQDDGRVKAQPRSYATALEGKGVTYFRFWNDVQ